MPFTCWMDTNGRVSVVVDAGDAKELLAQGFASMLVWVLAENPSRLFYEALGAELVDQKPTTVEGVELTMLAYGWLDLRLLVRQLEKGL